MKKGERQVGLIKEVLTGEILVSAMLHGERETASVLYGISLDHQCRYRWVASKVTTEDKVLDAICGIGYGSYIMAKVGMQHPKEVLGFDICQEAIDYGNKYYRAANLTLKCSDFNKIELPIEYFSKVACFEAIEHVENPMDLLKLIYTSMQPKGTLYISCPNQATNPFSKERYPFHVKHYYSNELEAMLKQTGFKHVEWYSQANERSTSVDPGLEGVTMIGVVSK